MARKTGLKGLQEWAKHVTQAYSNVDITNMTTSFRDGLAFCAIIHRYRPDLIPYNSLKKGDVLKNNQLAFSVAEKELDIPALLDAEDMVALSVPDKLSVATYLVQYYNYFRDKAPSGPLASKSNLSSTNPLVEPFPPTKRTKVEVETIGPTTASPLPKLPQTTTATKAPPPVLTTDKKTVNSPALQHQPPPTHKPFPSRPPPPSAVETAPKGVTQNESSSKEGTPEPTEQGNKVKKGRRSKFKSQTCSNMKNGTMGMEVCDACGERVFLMERLSVEGHIFHRACFKCYTCQCLLKPGSYSHDSNGDVFYCQPHYREALRQSTLKRTMEQRRLLNGDDTSTEVKRKKEEQTTSTTTSKSSPGHEITKDESLKMRAGLPGLLKSLAENKREPNETIGNNMTSSEDTSSLVKPSSSTAEATSSMPAKPPPPKGVVETSRAKLIDSPTKERSKPPKPPTVAPRRPTWSPNVQSHDLPKRPTEPPKVPIEPPRRPTWSPKQPYEPPKRPSTASTEASRVRTEAPNVLSKTSKLPSDTQRRPTWSPKIQAVEGERSKGEVPKSTVAWITKGKVVDNATLESSPKIPRHSTVSGIPAKPSPPVTTRKIQPKMVTIEEDRAGVASKVGVAASPGGSPGPVKPPRRKKTTEKQHLPQAATAVETDEKLQPALSPSPGVPSTATKMESVPKKHAPPRPSHQPSLKMRNRSELDAYAACEHRHKKRLAELRRELRSLEQNQLKLEAKGIQLERQLRTKDIDVDDHLMEEWFSLVNEKNMLVRKESDLVYELRDLELIEQHDQLEKEIRLRVSKDDSLKSEVEKLEEEAMIAELVELVEKRDKLLWALHLEKGRDEEEDKQVELIANVSGFSVPKHLHRSKTHI